MIDPNEFVPEALFWHDHWSTLAYLETVLVDCGGFQVGLDARMRQNRRNFRVMMKECPRPKRTGLAGMSQSGAIPMDPEHGTRLQDGTVLEWSDDWSCVQDMAAAGYFTCGPDAVEPKVILHLSEKGQAICARLRQHKANGGNWRNFQAPPTKVPVLGDCLLVDSRVRSSAEL